MNKETMKAVGRARTPEQSLEYWQSVINSISDEVSIIDQDFRIIFVNEAVRRIFKSPKAWIIGRHCYTLFHDRVEPCALADDECPAKKTWETGQASQAIHVHKHIVGDINEERFVNVTSTPVRDKKGRISHVVMVTRDITKAKRMEQGILEANQNLLALNMIANTVSQSLDLDTVLNSALDKVLELMQGNTGGILLLDREAQTLSYRVYRGLSEEFVRGISGLKLGEGIAGMAAQQGEPIYVDDISKDPRVTRAVVVTEGLRAFASVPLKAKGRVLGVMNIASHTLQRFTSQDVQLLSSISNQIAVAIENARLHEELHRKEEMRGDLLHLTISAQEEERRRIARGLHDEISQALTSLAVNLEAVTKSLPLDTEQLKAKLRWIQSIAISTLDEIHKVIWQLRPTLLDDLGLIAAVEWLAETNLERAGIRVHIEAAVSEIRLPANVETALFRIIQEAITNIIRHAEAESVTISLNSGKERLGVHIEDDGKGFDLDEAMRATKRGRGLGLLSMKERVELLGGALNIRTQLGHGTQIDIEIPVHSEEVSNV